MVNLLSSENGRTSLRPSRKNENFLFRVMPDNVNREFLLIGVIPDIFYRGSILAFFGWIPAYNVRG